VLVVSLLPPFELTLEVAVVPPFELALVKTQVPLFELALGSLPAEVTQAWLINA
jgi:hypothetical protein